MRKIDADALKEEIDYYIREAGWGETRNEALRWCLEFIDNQPTIEPERKKGEWIPSFNGRFTGGAYWFHCSKCERIVPDVRNGGWNFCPNCGADLRGD